MLLKILGVSDFSNFSSRSGDRTGEKQMSKFIPGQSGNPNGRPRGTGVVAKLRRLSKGYSGRYSVGR